MVKPIDTNVHSMRYLTRRFERDELGHYYLTWDGDDTAERDRTEGKLLLDMGEICRRNTENTANGIMYMFLHAISIGGSGTARSRNVFNVQQNMAKICFCIVGLTDNNLIGDIIASGFL